MGLGICTISQDWRIASGEINWVREPRTTGTHFNPILFQLHSRSQCSSQNFWNIQTLSRPLSYNQMNKWFYHRLGIFYFFASLTDSHSKVEYYWDVSLDPVVKTDRVQMQWGCWDPLGQHLKPEVSGIAGCQPSNVSPQHKSCGHHYLFAALSLTFIPLGSGSEHRGTTRHSESGLRGGSIRS